MITKDENLLIKVVKKAVGLPTGNSSCGCSTPVPAANECCGADTTESSSSERGCECSAAQQHEEQPTQP